MSYRMPDRGRGYSNRDIVLTIENVSKKFNSKQVFSGVNMQLLRGQSVVILGKDGCGKSTFLKIIGGLLKCDEGKVIYNNKNISINYLPQNFSHVNMTTSKYIRYVGSMRGLKKDDCDKSADILFNSFRMQDIVDVHMGKISEQDRQKVGAVQALITQPELLILDEPMTNQNRNQQLVFCDFVKNYMKNGTTVVMASTDRNVINNLATSTFELGGALSNAYM